jgi:hypothetical protein
LKVIEQTKKDLAAIKAAKAGGALTDKSNPV